MAFVRWLLFAGMFVLFGVLLLLGSELYGLIKREHPGVWNRKQARRWGSGFSGKGGGFSLLSFSPSELAQLGNSEVERLAQLMSSVRVVFFIVFGVLVLTFLWGS
jgi:hypothetical protein